MTATATAALPAALVDERDEQVHDHGPHGRAPGEAQEQAEVRVQPMSLGNRVHSVTVLFCIAAVQLTWLVFLTYGAFSLLR
jgi:hypothetical protein